MKPKRKQFEENKKMVIDYLTRSDNSSILPSKKDVLAHGQQRYALNDTLKNIYSKFQAEYSHVRMSFSTFSRQKPKWIKCIKWISRRQCLCLRHQNAALKLKAIQVFRSPNAFLAENTPEEIQKKLQELPNKKIKFEVWKSEEIKCSSDKIMNKIQLQENEVDKERFVEMFENELELLRQHVHRTTQQFLQIKKLRTDLDIASEVTVQMDYSENYTCVFQNEPSQVFYNRQLITVHPMVVHFKSDDGQIQHKSFVGISDITSHAAPTTLLC
jgi:hypothetical protein